MKNSKYYVYFINGISCWSDNDYSHIDNVTYYDAPKDCAIGTRCTLVGNKVVPTPLPESEVKKIKALTERKKYLNKLIKKIKKHKDKLIQTIPAHIRTLVLGVKKEHPKTYTSSTWQNFYQRCQNIRFDQDIIHEKRAREAASWVVNRIEFFSNLARNLKDKVELMDLDELKNCNVKDLWDSCLKEADNDGLWDSCLKEADNDS